jgi:hypothetical protein
MAKTAQWGTMRFAKVEVSITAAAVAAIAGLTTSEWIDLSSVFAGPLDQPQNPTRDKEETPVSGDAAPILSVGPNSGREFAFSFLYTEGETLGTDNLDPYQDIFKAIMEDDAALSVPMRWSPAGGAGGDYQYSTSTTESFMVGLTDPIGGVDSSKIMFTVTIATPDLTAATV